MPRADSAKEDPVRAHHNDAATVAICYCQRSIGEGENGLRPFNMVREDRTILRMHKCLADLLREKNIAVLVEAGEKRSECDTLFRHEPFVHEGFIVGRSTVGPLDSPCGRLHRSLRKSASYSTHNNPITELQFLDLPGTTFPAEDFGTRELSSSLLRVNFGDVGCTVRYFLLPAFARSRQIEERIFGL